MSPVIRIPMSTVMCDQYHDSAEPFGVSATSSLATFRSLRRKTDEVKWGDGQGLAFPFSQFAR